MIDTGVVTAVVLVLVLIVDKRIVLAESGSCLTDQAGLQKHHPPALDELSIPVTACSINGRLHRYTGAYFMTVNVITL